MKGVERTNTVVVRNPLLSQGREKGMRRDPYIIEVDRRRNCYICEGFGHLA